jgi:glycosyltransferase involved in cell wall biosynthesis
MNNIGIFTHDLYPFVPWGQGRYVYDLVRCISKAYQENIFVFSPFGDIRNNNHIQIFPGSHDTAGKNITFSIKLACIIERLVNKYNLGLVHFQGGPGGLFLLKKLSVPLIYTVHHTFYQQSRYIQSLQWKRILYLWERFGYKRSDYLMCVSDSTRRIVLRNYGASRKLCETIPIGVDQDRFFPLNFERMPNSLFFLGRLESRKGIDFLIKTIPKVKERLNDIQLFIGGDGFLRPFLENFIKQNHLENNVHLLGTVDDSELNEWYNKVSLVVIPSIFEGFGLTAIEAVACGTPVIATEVDGLRDVIEDEVNGLLVQYNDVEALSAKIIYLLKDKDKQSKLSLNGKKKAATIYNWNSISQDILKVYEYVLGKSSD